MRVFREGLDIPEAMESEFLQVWGVVPLELAEPGQKLSDWPASSL
jgi:hypothetical protein